MELEPDRAIAYFLNVRGLDGVVPVRFRFPPSPPPGLPGVYESLPSHPIHLHRTWLRQVDYPADDKTIRMWGGGATGRRAAARAV